MEPPEKIHDSTDEVGGEGTKSYLPLNFPFITFSLKYQKQRPISIDNGMGLKKHLS
jgi:hypothetical protein